MATNANVAEAAGLLDQPTKLGGRRETGSLLVPPVSPALFLSKPARDERIG